MACDNESAEMVLRGMLVCVVPHILYILLSTPRFVTLVHYVYGGMVNGLCPALPQHKEKAKTYNASGNKIQPGTIRNAPQVAFPRKELDTAWVYWDMFGEDEGGEEEEEASKHGVRREPGTMEQSGG